MVCDIVSLTGNDTDDENMDNDDSDDVDNSQDQENVKEPPTNEVANVTAEQNDGEIEMVPDNKGAENVQPYCLSKDVTFKLPRLPLQPSTASTSVPFLKPAPVNVAATYPMVMAAAQQNSNVSEPSPSIARKQCFWCEESFIKEESLRNHFKSDHGIVLMNAQSAKAQKENKHENEPGKYAKAKKFGKRKRSIAMAENSGDNEDDGPEQASSVKAKKPALDLESKRRSNPRV